MSAFTKWVDGENTVPLKTDFQPVRERTPKEKPAALGDTLGIASILIAVAILTGELVPIFKLILVLVFMFLTGPVVTHLIAGAEVETHKNAGHEYKEVDRR